MATKVLAGVNCDVTEEGYMNDPKQWNIEVANAIATEEGITLSDTHFKILDFIRTRFEKGDALTIRSIGNSGIVDIKGFYQLFPGAPLKKASKIAGIPKPSSCV